jgi:CNT family concentrative nucleoside transporter
VALRYASALFELARDANAVDAVAGDLGRFDQMIRGSEDLQRLIRNPVFTAEVQSGAVLLNFVLGWAGGLVGMPDLSLQGILGFLLRPLAWVMGVPWQDTAYVGGLIGLKTTLNEFVAYAQFGNDLAAGIELAPRSALILTYALLGFANFSSIAIQIGGIGGLAPERRPEIAKFGLRAMIAGNLAAMLSASLAGMLA